MKKLLFAFAMLVMGAFAFSGTPAQAMPAGAVTGMSDILKPGGTAEPVHYHWRRRGFCWRYPYHWRCRGRGYRRGFCYYNPWHWRCRPRHHRRYYYYRW